MKSRSLDLHDVRVVPREELLSQTLPDNHMSRKPALTTHFLGKELTLPLAFVCRDDDTVEWCSELGLLSIGASVRADVSLLDFRDSTRIRSSDRGRIVSVWNAAEALHLVDGVKAFDAACVGATSLDVATAFADAGTRVPRISVARSLAVASSADFCVALDDLDSAQFCKAIVAGATVCLVDEVSCFGDRKLLEQALGRIRRSLELLCVMSQSPSVHDLPYRCALEEVT